MYTMTYRGKLTLAQRQEIDALLGYQSVRGIARKLDLPYGQVRGYVEKIDEVMIEVPEHQLKALIIDVENAPFENYGWRTDQYIAHYLMKDPSFIVAVSVRWLGTEETYSFVVTPEEAVMKDDERIMTELWPFLQEADIFIGHNVQKHDLKTIEGRGVLHQLPFLGPKRFVDTLTIAKDFNYPHRSMDALCEMFGIPTGNKIGMHNWKKIMKQGDPEALRLLEQYNRADIDSSEALFERLMPYSRRITRLFDGPDFNCPYCGSEELDEALKPSGEPDYYRTQVSTYKKWICGNCGKFSRSKTLAQKRHPLHPL